MDSARRVPTRIDLQDLQAVKKTVFDFVETCSSVGALPNVEALCAALGIPRSTFYNQTARSDRRRIKQITPTAARNRRLFFVYDIL